MVVSASADDGKTATSVNLAVAAARAGQRVILVDADLRRPSINAFLGLGRLRGLTDAIARPGCPSRRCSSPSASTGCAPAAGSIPPNPADFLAGPGMQRAHAELSASPTSSSTTRRRRSPCPTRWRSGGSSTPRSWCCSTNEHPPRAAAAVERLEQVGVPVLGTVMNAIRSRQRHLLLLLLVLPLLRLLGRRVDGTAATVNGNGNGSGSGPAGRPRHGHGRGDDRERVELRGLRTRRQRWASTFALTRS
jgi:hypothetical protein